MKAKSRLLRCVVLVVSALVVLGVALFAACVESGNTTEPDAPATVTGVTLSDSKLELIYGKTGSLTATVKMSDNGSYGGEYSWSSSDEEVAAVSGDSKTVTIAAVGVGDAVITVETEEKSASCSVTVAAAVTDISLSSEKLELVIGGEETATLEATITMSDESEYTGAYVWSSDDESVVEVEGNGSTAMITAVEEGTATVTVTAQDKSASCIVTVTEPEPDGPAGYLVYAKNSDGGYTVTGVKEDYADIIEEAVIPDTYKHSPVTAIGESAFEDCTTVKSVSIGDNVKNIENRAFYGCAGIYEVSIPDKVTNIGESAFENCTSMRTLTIGKGVSGIGNRAFYNCPSLDAICFNTVYEVSGRSYSGIYRLDKDNQIFSYAGQDADGITVTVGTSVTRIPDYLFDSYSDSSYAPNIESVIFADGGSDVSIGGYAFAYCASLTTLHFSDRAADVGSYAFAYCESLKSIAVPDGVTNVGSYAFAYCASLTSATVSDSVTRMGSACFAGCSNLESVSLPFAGGSASASSASSSTLFGYIFGSESYSGGTDVKQYYSSSRYSTYCIPSSLKEVEICGGRILYGAFYGCEMLSRIAIGGNVTSVGNYAFYNCASLTEFRYDVASTVNFSSNNRVFYNAGQEGDGMAVTIGSSAKSVPAYMFYPDSDMSHSPNVTSLSFEEGGVCESVGDYSFYGCTSLESAEIGDNVASVGKYLFCDCVSLERVTLGKNLESIGDHMFCNCSSLMEIEIPDGVESIGDEAFENCASLVNIDIPDSVTSVGDYSFYGCTSLESAEIGDNVASVGKYLFCDCVSLERVTLGKNLESIGDHMFCNCSSLMEIEIPDGVESIGDEAFAYCVSLTSIDIPDGVTSVGENIFEGCMSLTDVTMGSGLKEISNYMFCFCTALEEITIPSNITVIGYLAFYGCTALKSLTIPNSVSTIGSFCFLECTALESVVIDGRNLTFEGGTFYSCTSLKSVTLGNGLKEIGDSMFYGCTALESVVIPDGASRIGTYAFYGCTGLKSVTIGTGVKTIGTYAFYGCTALTEINYNATAASDLWFYNYVFYRAGIYGGGITLTIGANVTRMPAYLFCPDLNFFNYPPKITAIIFENGSVCTSIGEYCFYPCSSLTTIVFPASIMYVEYFSFGLCSYLNTIYYCGTEEEWSGIFFASSIVDGYNLNRATKYWYSEEDPQDSSGKYWHYDDDGEIAVW